MMKVKARGLVVGLAVLAAFGALPGLGLAQEPADCLDCHGVRSAAGGPGHHPGIVKQWEVSAHAEAGVGCVDCHGVPASGGSADLSNTRYVVQTTWDKASGLKRVELALQDGKPVERPDVWKHEGVEIVVNVSPRTCAGCHG